MARADAALNGGPDLALENVRLTVGIAAWTSFQQVTQQGDGKANMLLAVHVGLVAVVATQSQQLRAVPSHGWSGVGFWAATVVYLVSFIVDGYLIASAIRPRQAVASGHSPFAFPVPTSGVVAFPGDVVTCGDQVWEMAQAMGRVAAEKNALLAKAVSWSAVMVLSAAAWMAVVAALNH
jgi:hypothetical protein